MENYLDYSILVARIDLVVSTTEVDDDSVIDATALDGELKAAANIICAYLRKHSKSRIRAFYRFHRKSNVTYEIRKKPPSSKTDSENNTGDENLFPVNPLNALDGDLKRYQGFHTAALTELSKPDGNLSNVLPDLPPDTYRLLERLNKSGLESISISDGHNEISYKPKPPISLIEECKETENITALLTNVDERKRSLNIVKICDQQIVQEKMSIPGRKVFLQADRLNQNQFKELIMHQHDDTALTIRYVYEIDLLTGKRHLGKGMLLSYAEAPLTLPLLPE